jgi:hypothetical protein
MLERFARRAAGDTAGNERVDAVAHQQVVLKADEETRLARVPLPPGAAPELEIHAVALVSIRADHIEAAQGGDPIAFHLVLASQPDVGPAAGHVRGDRDRTDPAGARDHARFPRVVLRVQDLARDPCGAQPDRQTLRLLNREGPDQHRPLGCVRALDLVDDGPFLGVAIGKDDVRVIDANHRTMCGNDDHVEAVEISEL